MYVTGLLFCFCLHNVSPKLIHKELYVICLKINKLKICFNLLKNKESNTTEQITFSHFQRQTSIINLKSVFSETQKLTQMFLKLTWSRIVHVCSVARLCPTLSTPRTVALQAPLSMEFFRQEYWSGLPFTHPGDLPDLGIEPTSPAAPALTVNSLPLNHWEAFGK